MLVQKLQVDDLQSEKGYFDGIMVYAQNKVGEENDSILTIFPPLLYICLTWLNRKKGGGGWHNTFTVMRGIL